MACVRRLLRVAGYWISALTCMSALAAPANADGYGTGSRFASPAIWSGAYVGVNYGIGWGESDWSLPNDTGTANLDRDVLFGGQAGYQGQWGNVVAGIDISYSGIHVGGTAPCGTGQCATAIDNLLLTNGRVGYAFGRLLLYGTGGWARSTIGVSAREDRHVSGWDIGGGYEYAILPNVIGGVEYIHVDYDDETFGSNSVDTELDTVKARLTVRLDRSR